MNLSQKPVLTRESILKIARALQAHRAQSATRLVYREDGKSATEDVYLLLHISDDEADESRTDLPPSSVLY